MSVYHDFNWSVLVHLGSNFWYEVDNTRHVDHLANYTEDSVPKRGSVWQIPASNSLRLDRALWNEYTEALRDAGANTLILDIGDGIVYDSHPELAIEGSWTRAELLAEIDRLHSMGFELVPKLNFSTAHDIWLKEYSYMVSTSTYYKVCKDVIDEVCEIFKPKYLHLGMDEETYGNQKYYDYAVVRQNDLWWHDLYYLVDCVEKNNARAIMWSDYARDHPEEYVEKCPKSVVTCPYYYFDQFYGDITPDNETKLRPFALLDKHGYDQLSCGSNEYFEENLELLTEYCKKTVSKEHLKGFLLTTWKTVTEPWRSNLMNSAECMKRARALYESL